MPRTSLQLKPKKKNVVAPAVLQVLLGKKSSYNQDSVQFYKANGVWTFQLDDDGCYCQTTLEMGKDLCGNGIQNRFGVDLQDTGCGRVSTKKSLFIYVRMNEPKQAACTC